MTTGKVRLIVEEKKGGEMMPNRLDYLSLPEEHQEVLNSAMLAAWEGLTVEQFEIFVWLMERAFGKEVSDNENLSTALYRKVSKD